MTNNEIKQILISKGVTHLYHANTVATACTFINNNGLLSRGTVRDLGLFQTPQDTDGSDQEFDVFYDIFFDSVDVHQRSNNINYYGPVTFVYSIDLLDHLPPESVSITKNNPKYWHSDMAEDEKYFLTREELINYFIRGDFKQHITIRHQTTPIAFDFLEEIILDDPRLDDNDCFIKACEGIQMLLDRYAYDIPLVIRECDFNCKCTEKYRSYTPWYVRSRFNIR